MEDLSSEKVVFISCTYMLPLMEDILSKWIDNSRAQKKKKKGTQVMYSYFL